MIGNDTNNALAFHKFLVLISGSKYRRRYPQFYYSDLCSCPLIKKEKEKNFPLVFSCLPTYMIILKININQYNIHPLMGRLTIIWLRNGRIGDILIKRDIDEEKKIS